MTDFSFCNPVRIEFGKDKEKHIGQYMKEAGAKKSSHTIRQRARAKERSDGRCGG